MTLALKNEKGDFILFDVVTDYSKTYPSKVTQHPVDGSGTVSDHVIKDNVKISIKGVLTGADFNSGKPTLSSEDRSEVGVGVLVFPSVVANQVTINYNGNPLNLFPDVTGEFFNDPSAVVSGLSEGRYDLYNERASVDILQGFHDNKEKLTLYEFDGNELITTRTLENVYLTSFRPRESAKSGDSIYFNMSLEKVVISQLLEEEVPEEVSASFSEDAQEKINKGPQSGDDSSIDTDLDAVDDPETQSSQLIGVLSRLADSLFGGSE